MSAGLMVGTWYPPPSIDQVILYLKLTKFSKSIGGLFLNVLDSILTDLNGRIGTRWILQPYHPFFQHWCIHSLEGDIISFSGSYSGIQYIILTSYGSPFPGESKLPSCPPAPASLHHTSLPLLPFASPLILLSNIQTTFIYLSHLAPNCIIPCLGCLVVYSFYSILFYFIIIIYRI